jgi:hypothetical protein
MTLTRFITPTVLAAALAFTASPAAAQRRGGGRVSHGAVSHGTAAARSAPVYRGGFNGNRVVVRGGVLPRSGFYYRPSYSGYYNYRPYYTFRPHVSLGIGLWAGYPIGWSAYFAYGYPYYNGYYPAAPSYYGGYYGYPSPSYPPNYYDDPPTSTAPNYPPNTSDYGSTYPQQPQQGAGSIAVQPGNAQQPSGGVTFEITPGNASVFVDGTYMGTGGEFGPTTQPLGLSVGRHHVEIRAEGYRTMSFDADVTAGQVTPYRAELQRQ